MPRDFVPTPSTNAQFLRNLCEHVGYPVPTALFVEAQRADIHDEIRTAEKVGDTDRADALRKSNVDLLNEDRESVLERLIAENRNAAEQGDRAAAVAAARLQAELDEYRDRNVDYDPGIQLDETDDDNPDNDPEKDGDS